MIHGCVNWVISDHPRNNGHKIFLDRRTWQNLRWQTRAMDWGEKPFSKLQETKLSPKTGRFPKLKFVEPVYISVYIYIYPLLTLTNYVSPLFNPKISQFLTPLRRREHHLDLFGSSVWRPTLQRLAEECGEPGLNRSQPKGWAHHNWNCRCLRWRCNPPIDWIDKRHY